MREDNRDELVANNIKELLGEADFSANDINVCAPGFQVFSKFVKLPSVEASKVNQIIRFEAQQNVPFPLEEVVWDYQILGTTPNDELEVLLVAIRNEVVESIFKIGEGAGLKLQLVDVSSAALANAYRFSYGDSAGCVLLLDIGAKSSNLLFFEQGRVFSRSINIGANAITQDFAAESKLDWDEAERLKIEEGFVSLGGAYEEPDNPNQALISKIARQVMTRLHIQVNQTIQFYRGQQGGLRPEKLYLAGGASLLPYTAQFFAEKLNIPVDYFNPFRNVQIDEDINLEDIAKVAHTFGEVVGLGIRNLAQCPVDLNLMPASYLKLQRLNSKRSYFVASVLAIVLTISSFGIYSNWIAVQAAQVHAQLKESFDPLKRAQQQLLAAQGRLSSAQGDPGRYGVLFDSKTAWMNVLLEVQRIMLAAQTNHGVTVDASVESQPVVARVWIEKLRASVEAQVDPMGFDPDSDPDRQDEENPEEGPKIGVLDPRLQLGAPLPAAGTQKVGFINLNCRALNLVQLSPSANTEFCYALQDAFRSSELFSEQETGLYGQLALVADTNATFGFSMVLKLNDPLVVN